MKSWFSLRTIGSWSVLDHCEDEEPEDLGHGIIIESHVLHVVHVTPDLKSVPRRFCAFQYISTLELPRNHCFPL